MTKIIITLTTAITTIIITIATTLTTIANNKNDYFMSYTSESSVSLSSGGSCDKSLIRSAKS